MLTRRDCTDCAALVRRLAAIHGHHQALGRRLRQRQLLDPDREARIAAHAERVSREAPAVRNGRPKKCDQ
jgi:hypothetical protein